MVCTVSMSRYVPKAGTVLRKQKTLHISDIFIALEGVPRPLSLCNREQVRCTTLCTKFQV